MWGGGLASFALRIHHSLMYLAVRVRDTPGRRVIHTRRTGWSARAHAPPIRHAIAPPALQSSERVHAVIVARYDGALGDGCRVERRRGERRDPFACRPPHVAGEVAPNGRRWQRRTRARLRCMEPWAACRLAR